MAHQTGVKKKNVFVILVCINTFYLLLYFSRASGLTFFMSKKLLYTMTLHTYTFRLHERKGGHFGSEQVSI